MSDLKWEKLTRTDETTGVAVTEDNILDLARTFGGAVKFDQYGSPVYITNYGYGYDVPLGGYVGPNGEPLSTDFYKVEVEVEEDDTLPGNVYKVGDRLEIHDYNDRWNGPVTVLNVPLVGYPYYRIRTDTGLEGGFTDIFLRPLVEAPLADWERELLNAYEPKEKVYGRGDFKFGDRVLQVTNAWSPQDSMTGAVSGVIGTVRGFDNGATYDYYDAWQLAYVDAWQLAHVDA